MSMGFNDMKTMGEVLVKGAGAGGTRDESKETKQMQIENFLREFGRRIRENEGKIWM